MQHNNLFPPTQLYASLVAVLALFGFIVKATAQEGIGNDTLTSASVEKTKKNDQLIGRAVLDAATFAPGPTAGQYIGDGPINGQEVPFTDKQPVQGFSAVLDNKDGSFLAMSDNGFGSLENSADYHLRVYTIRPNFETKNKGEGNIEVISFFELHDPDQHIPFAITNHFTAQRILTGADFDIESFQQAKDGTFWFGDEFGPFLLHTDQHGKLLEPPIALPDFDHPGQEIRSPQNPFNEESSAIRVMNAMRTHAQINGNSKTPVFSPWFVLIDDDNPATYSSDRESPPAGLQAASSDIFNVAALQTAGFPVVAWTVNDQESMKGLIELNVDGIISDNPGLLWEVIESFDGNGDGQPDFLDEDGLINNQLFDAQGHRGGRSLRPENTLPAMEVALDYYMTTLETDAGITKDGIPVLDHDPHIESAKVRRADGQAYAFEDEVLIKDLTLEEIQTTFIADKLLPDRPDQTNDRTLSPVSVAFAEAEGLIDPYIMPSVQQLFDFVDFYVNYYKTGEGSSHPEAEKRWKNAQRVRFNIETKRNPRTDTDARGDVFAERTVDAETFAKAVADVIVVNSLQQRADIQSFDFNTLLVVQENYPTIRTVFIFGDFPKVGDAGDGTNLQDEKGENSPWLAGLYWPYRSTTLSHPSKAQGSGGFEGMALDQWNNRLLPLLEKPLIDDDEKILLIHEFDLANKMYTGKRYQYVLDEKGTAIGDFIMFSPERGLVIERDGSQGTLEGFKKIYEIEIKGEGEPLNKRVAVDLLSIKDPDRISEPELPGDVGVGENFAFPFVTIESVVVFNEKEIGVLNDNNFPFSIGRHVGAGLPDDNEFVILKLGHPLGELPILKKLKFTLLNADSQQAISQLQQGDIVNLTALQDPRLSVKVDVAPNRIDSVRLELTGPVTYQQVEKYWPYALFGDKPKAKGDGRKYVGLKWKPGEYTLTAIPYVNGSGATPQTVSFQVIYELAVNSFTLVNADTDNAIAPLENGDVVDLTNLGNARLSIRANTTPANVETVKLELSGPIHYRQVERYWPYALFGDEPKAGGSGRDFVGLFWEPGEYTLEATPLLNDKAGKSLIISFSVRAGSESTQAYHVEVFPVPTTGVVNIDHGGAGKEAKLSLVDFSGNVLLTRQLSEQPVETLDLSSFKKGLYFLKVIGRAGVQVKRVVVE